MDVLPPEIAARYAEHSPDLFRPKAEQTKAPFAKLVESDSDYIQLVTRLRQKGMVEFTTEPKCVNGVFATPKSDGMQRLVVDGRPANARFVPSPSMELPTPDLLAKLEVPEEETLYVAKSDLDNFYHRLRLPKWLRPYFALPPVRAGDIGLDGFAPDTLVYPCCTTLPMGWSHSAYLAQAAHEYILDTCTSLRPEDRITSRSDYRVDRPRHFVYIDDFGLAGLTRHRARLDYLHDEYNAVLAGKRLPPKLAKQVRSSCDGVECIGVELHGRDLTAGVHPRKLAKLVDKTSAYLRRGKCTGRDMEHIVGCWTWSFMARRAGLSAFSAVYRFIDAAKMKTFDIWPSVARELLVAIGLAPLLFASLSSPWVETVVATDASGSGQGVVAAPCSASDLSAMSTCPLPAKGGVILDRSIHPLLRDRSWREIISAPFVHAEHINVLELRALTNGVKWVLSSPSGLRARMLTWCDSMVVMYAVRKGRSSAYQLLKRLRILAAILMASGVTLYCNWIPTEVNPADVPSRRYEFDSTLGFPGEGPTSFLTEAAHARSTTRKYQKAVWDFIAWASRQGEDPRSLEDFDRVVHDYLVDLYLEREGAGRSYGEALVSGLHLYLPALKGHLHFTSLALRGWRRLVPSMPHPPMTWDLAVCVAVHLTSRNRFPMGVGVLLAFNSYLRIGELCGLTRRDVADSGDARLGPGFVGMALRLGKTKTGTNQWAEVRSAEVQQLLRLMVARTPRPDDRVFRFAASAFRKYFKQACMDLGLSPKYVPHSLRHGGATHDCIAGLPLEDILRLGRWASTKSARHYIQSGRALCLQMEVPPSITARARILVPRVLLALSLAQRH